MLRSQHPETDGDARAERPWAAASPGDLPSRILTLVDIAAAHGSSLSTAELAALLPDSEIPDAATLERVLRREACLRDHLAVLEGEVVPRGRESLAAESAPQRELARMRVGAAGAFAGRLAQVCPWVRLVGVSGSAAYGKARPDDDIDFFVVTAKGRLWITLVAAMVLARLRRLASGDGTVYCFNRMLEEDRCEEAFRDRREPLFAREALNLRVVLGDAYYARLLHEAPWMGEYFPSLYRERAARAEPPPPSAPGGVGWTVLNAAALLVAGSYLWLVGLARNRAHARRGNRPAQFRTVVRRGFCAYESNKYDDLRDAYLRAF